jgi:hypothetical protein
MRLGIEVPDVMEKIQCMLNPMDQASHEQSHFSKYESLLNQDME